MVEWKKLGEVCEKTSNIKWKDQAEDIIYKYIDLSSVSIDSHKVILTTEICKQNAPSRAQQIVNYNDILLGTTRPTLKRYCQVPSYLDNNICSTGFCIFRANKKYVLSRWLYHNIGSGKFWDYCELKQQGAGYPCLSNSDAFAYVIPVPSLSEQQRIVEQLDTFTSSIENLKEQIAQRRKQYEYYRDQLLDLEGNEGVEMKKLGNICKIGDGLHGTPIYDENGDYFFINGNNLSDGKIILKLETKKVDIEMFRKYGVELDEESILMSINGTIGNVAQYRNEKIVLGKSAAYFRIKNKNVLHFKYLYYFLQTTKANEYYNGALTGSTIKNLGLKAIRDFDIPITSLSEQQRIVSILDTFEASIRNLEQQLAQREKQYEYYRNKLLIFE